MRPVRYVGYLNESTGLGSAARKHALALAQAGVPVQARAVGLSRRGPEHYPLDTQRFPELGALEGHAATPPGVEIVHTLPREFGVFATGECPSIGVTAWEVERLPPRWGTYLDAVDELWVPSSFSARAFAGQGKPVWVIPHPVPVAGSEPEPLPDIPPQAFVFLAVLEWQDRKNPEGVLRAFRDAFHGRADVILLLKLGRFFATPSMQVEQALRRCTRSARPWPPPTVFVIDERLSDATLDMLYRRADAYVSLHRAEGFGLCMAEAMARRRPVVATAYSGNLEYMDAESAFLVDYDLVPAHERAARREFDGSSVWAEPSHDAAVEALRRCFGDANGRAAIALAGQQRVRDDLSPQRVGTMMRARVEALC